MSPYQGFTTVELRKPPRSKFDLSHEKRITCRMGDLVPVFISETMPNDTFRCNTEVLMRLAPLKAPIYHRLNCFVHFFFVPNRLLWVDWEKFITNGRLGTETPPVPPNTPLDEIGALGLQLFAKGQLWDYLGGNPLSDADLATFGDTRIDIMPFAAYYKCWYDYYRDRNYVADNTILPLISGETNPGAAGFFALKTRDYQKDYFTSALPFTQRGNEVLMPLSGTGAVTYLPTSVLKTTAGADTTEDRLIGSGTDASTDHELFVNKTVGSDGQSGRLENIDTVNITTSDVSINDLRRAIKLQEWLERNALAGSRYTEAIWAHFNRRTSDGRLQRAEYLGGGKVILNISEVVNTAYSLDAADQTVPPATMTGHSKSFGNTNQFTYNCEEHGFVIGIMSVMPNTAYMQGVPRMFLQRNTFLDYPFPSFAHLGEQEVYKYELYGSTTNIPLVRSTAPVFGYQSRYADWKYIPSSSHGDFRNTMDFWHLTRKFASSPTLGDTFVKFEDTLQDRVFAVSGVDTLWCYIYNNCSVIRSLPYYGTPML